MDSAKPTGTSGRQRWLRRMLAGLLPPTSAGLLLAGLFVPSGSNTGSVATQSTRREPPTVATSSFTFAAGNSAVRRIYGTDAIGTSILVSQTEFPTSGSAKAVVLARSDFFSDALAGGPLAAHVGGPLLITPGAPVSSSLDSRVQGEVQRVLRVGGTVYILGGDLALSPQIDAALEGLGYTTQRIAGPDEYATAVDIAELLGNPSVIFEATGLASQDALSAVPAAIVEGGAILLTDGSTQAPETAAYLVSHPAADTRYAVGGPLAAYGADPSATPVYGQDLYGTSAAVARTFFAGATVFGAATGADFPDALSGGPFMGAPAERGPVLLVPPSGPLPVAIADYLLRAVAAQETGYLFGGPLAVGNDVESELESPVLAPTQSLAVITRDLPIATVGTPYSATLSASGGTSPYSWSVSAGSLPSGLSLSSNGTITGTPSGQDSSSFTVEVTDATTPTPLTATSPLSISVFAPQVPVVPTANWSGYQVTSGPYTSVTGTFTVPYVDSGTLSSDLAEWVGIDGASNDSLIQAGVLEQNLDGSLFVQPWWEILPDPATPITTVSVAPGDTVTVSIGEVSGTEWGISLTDDTNGQSFTTDQAYGGPLSSAEWIVEAPSEGSILTTLAPYSPGVYFSDLGTTGSQTALTDLVMIQRGQQVSTPSSFDSNGFNVAYGGSAPPAP